MDLYLKGTESHTFCNYNVAHQRKT
uniref:Uncharacterized protein n=1 Tax=Arundo donax TaxID=35708 RepID=A0A0A9FTL6_ARUDO